MIIDSYRFLPRSFRPLYEHPEPDGTDAVWSPFEKRLSDARIALLTSSGMYLANSQDVNGDGLPDLVVKIEAKDLDPEQFINGRAYLRVHETSDPQSAVLYEGYEAITAVPAE